MFYYYNNEIGKKGQEKTMNLSKKILYVVEAEQKKQGISARELAKRIGCTDRIISCWKTGKRNISLKMAEKVLAELGYQLIIVKKDD